MVLGAECQQHHYFAHLQDMSSSALLQGTHHALIWNAQQQTTTSASCCSTLSTTNGHNMGANTKWRTTTSVASTATCPLPITYASTWNQDSSHPQNTREVTTNSLRFQSHSNRMLLQRASTCATQVSILTASRLTKTTTPFQWIKEQKQLY